MKSVSMKTEGENMMRVRWVGIVQVLVVSGGLLAAQVESALDARAARCFRVQWSSVRYDKSVVVENPAISKTPQGTSETVTLSCQVEIRDPSLVLGVSREAVVTQIIDGEGRQIAVDAPVTRPHQMFEGLRYEQQFRRPKVSRWDTIVNFVMRHPPPAPGPPQFVTELQPSRITMRLDKTLLGRDSGELPSVKGYFHALVAESIENIDVPFEPNDTWVRLTPDLEIQVREAVCTASSYRFWIDTRPRGAGGMRPLAVGEPLPGRMVVNRQFIGEDGKPSRYSGTPPILPAPVGGRGSGGGGPNSQVKAIRFVIASNPTERKIPFEVSHIPLPNPEQ